VKKQLVDDFINKDFSLRELSNKYKISYSAARSICLKYEIYGEASLYKTSGNFTKNRNEKRINSLDPKDKEIALLKKKIKDLEMETDLLKKLNELLD